jgi:hypothetical protein
MVEMVAAAQADLQPLEMFLLLLAVMVVLEVLVVQEALLAVMVHIMVATADKFLVLTI